MDNFNQFILNSGKKLDSFVEKNKKDEFYNELGGLYPIALNLFRPDMEAVFDRLKLNQFIKKIRQENSVLLKKIEFFDVREDGSIFIKDSLGVFESKIVDLDGLISTFTEKEKKFKYLVSSYFCQQPNFIEIQLFFALNKRFQNLK